MDLLGTGALNRPDTFRSVPRFSTHFERPDRPQISLDRGGTRLLGIKLTMHFIDPGGHSVELGVLCKRLIDSFSGRLLRLPLGFVSLDVDKFPWEQ